MLSYFSDESGEWLAATRAGCLVVVRTDGTRESSAGLWASLDGGEQGILDFLTAGGLSATPQFALVTWAAAPATGLTGRAIVRGAVSLRLTGDNGTVLLSGLGVSTWREQPFAAVAELTMECGAVGALPGLLPSLPLSAGMVRSGRITMVAAVAVQVTEDAVAAVPVVERPDREQAPPAATVSKLPVSELPVSEMPVSETPASEITISEMTISDETVAGVRRDGEGQGQASAPGLLGVAAPQGYDHLFGATMMRGVELAAVRPADAEAAHAIVAETDAAGALDAGALDAGALDTGALDAGALDAERHDGLTVMSGDIRKLRDSRRQPRPEPEPAVAPAPTLYLLLPNGVREPLGRPVVVGRAPGVSKVSGGQVPRLVSLSGADQDISRNHVRFTVEGDTVVVTDLHSRNGTIIVLPGKSPQKLRGGESASVIVGTVVDLGSGVTLTVGQDPGEHEGGH